MRPGAGTLDSPWSLLPTNSRCIRKVEAETLASVPMSLTEYTLPQGMYDTGSSRGKFWETGEKCFYELYTEAQDCSWI